MRCGWDTMATVDLFLPDYSKVSCRTTQHLTCHLAAQMSLKCRAGPVHACIPYFWHVPPNLSSLSFEPHCSRHHKAINTFAHLFSQWQNVYCMLLYTTANLTSQLFSATTGAAPLCFFTQRSEALLPQRRARAEVSQTNWVFRDFHPLQTFDILPGSTSSRS